MGWGVEECRDGHEEGKLQECMAELSGGVE